MGISERKQVPVGTSDFKKIVEEFYYIDKSLLISEKLEEQAKNAYQQVLDKNYDAKLKKRNKKTIYRYGVAFYKKTLAVYGGCIL